MPNTIITSALDNDLYKFTMMQAVWKTFPDTQVSYRFKCRSNVKMDQPNKEKLLDRLSEEIDKLKVLKFTKKDTEILYNIGFFSKRFCRFLTDRPLGLLAQFLLYSDKDSDLIELSFTGPWLDTILLEVPLLAIISEIGLDILSSPYRKNNFEPVLDEAIDKRLEFAKNHPNFKFADFGTRRRFSKAYHEKIVRKFKEASDNHMTDALIGTSNVYLANKYNLKPIGTHAHEWFMAMQAKTNILNFQKLALQKWADVYQGSLGIALSDCVGMDNFLIDFNSYFAKLFDGCRHDSGDPHIWTKKLLSHYKKLGIDPKTKTIIYSDGLTFETGSKLQELYSDKINVGLGIGTYFTNDISSTVPSISMVIKMTECDGQPVAKLSDSPGKEMCEDENYVKFMKRMFNIDTEKKN